MLFENSSLLKLAKLEIRQGQDAMPNGDLNTAEEGKLPSPLVALQEMARGYWTSQAISVAAELGICDLLKDGPKKSEELAQSAGADTLALYRLLRALSRAGVFTEDEDGCFSLAPIGEYLRTDVPNSMCAVAAEAGESYRWQAWGDLLRNIKTGETAFDHIFGMQLFEYYKHNPQAGVHFDKFMGGIALQKAQVVTHAYDFSSIGKLVDVGGGKGNLLVAILKTNPALKGVLFDLPATIEGARKYVEEENLGGRCELIAGDFFESVPSGGGTYFLSTVIHDWHDERAITILKNCYSAMAEDDILLLLERVLPPRGNVLTRA